jgi:hypothetical protein
MSMGKFENPYAENDPFVEGHVDGIDWGGKLRESAIQRQMESAGR